MFYTKTIHTYIYVLFQSKAAYVLFYMRRDSHTISHHTNRQCISAALGAPRNTHMSSPDDDDAASSSDEDCSMDVN